VSKGLASGSSFEALHPTAAAVVGYAAAAASSDNGASPVVGATGVVGAVAAPVVRRVPPSRIPPSCQETAPSAQAPGGEVVLAMAPGGEPLNMLVGSSSPSGPGVLRSKPRQAHTPVWLEQGKQCAAWTPGMPVPVAMPAPVVGMTRLLAPELAQAPQSIMALAPRVVPTAEYCATVPTAEYCAAVPEALANVPCAFADTAAPSLAPLVLSTTGSNPAWLQVAAEPSPSFGGSPTRWASSSPAPAAAPLQGWPAPAPRTALFQSAAPEGDHLLQTTSDATLPGQAAQTSTQRDMTSESSAEELVATDANQGAFLCELAVLAADLPHLLDPLDFHSVVSFTSMSQANVEVKSHKPHRFVAHSQESLASNFVHVLLRPLADDGCVTLELETYFPLSHVVDCFGYGQGHKLSLGLLPRGSGATPEAIFRHCSLLGKADANAGDGSGSKISLSCSVLEKPGGLWRSQPDLEYLANGQWPAAVSRACPSNGYRPAEGEAPEPAHRRGRSEWDEQRPSQERRAGEAESSHSQSPPGNHGACSPFTDGGWDEEQEHVWLQEELKRARNELRMQQTLMNFQERRLQVFEAQSNAIAAVGAASQGYDASMSNPRDEGYAGVQEQIRHLGDQVQMQQDEIFRLRDQLSFQQAGGSGTPNFMSPWQQPQRQEFQQPPAPAWQTGQQQPEHWQQRPQQQQQQQQQPRQEQQSWNEQARFDQALYESRAQMGHELIAREQRIAELELALQERDQQLDMIPDAVESILRSPPRPLEGSFFPAEVMAGVYRGSPLDFRGSPLEAMASAYRGSPTEAMPAQRFDNLQQAQPVAPQNQGWQGEPHSMNMSRALAHMPDGMVQAFQQSANTLDNIVTGARPQELPQQQYRSINIGDVPMHGSAAHIGVQVMDDMNAAGRDGRHEHLQHTSDERGVSLGDPQVDAFGFATDNHFESREGGADSTSMSMALDANISQHSYVKSQPPNAAHMASVAEPMVDPRAWASSQAELSHQQPPRPDSPAAASEVSTNAVALLQYSPRDPRDTLDLVVAECIAYLAIPKKALGFASLHCESQGVYNLGRHRFVLSQLDDGGLYMQHGTQWVPFDAWLLEEARTHMSQLHQEEEQRLGSYPGSQKDHLDGSFQGSHGATQRTDDWNCAEISNSTATLPMPEAVNSSAFASFPAQPPAQLSVPGNAQRTENFTMAWSNPPQRAPESPSSAKRSLFSASPEGFVQEKSLQLNSLASPQKAASFSRTNVEIDVQIDIVADSVGTTGTIMDCHGPYSPTASTADVQSGSCRSTNDIPNY